MYYCALARDYKVVLFKRFNSKKVEYRLYEYKDEHHAMVAMSNDKRGKGSKPLTDWIEDGRHISMQQSR